MKDDAQPTKQHVIQQAAAQAFATYGFRKTSMDDIARGAGMSRPAVYLHYKGKEDIFRSLVQQYYETTAQDLRAALERPGPPAEQLIRAFDAQLGEAMAALLNSPHGLELFDTGAATAADIKQEGEACLQSIYADWLTRELEKGHVRFDAQVEDVAGTICDSIKAIKHGGADFETVTLRLHILAQLIGDGMTVARIAG